MVGVSAVLGVFLHSLHPRTRPARAQTEVAEAEVAEAEVAGVQVEPEAATAEAPETPEALQARCYGLLVAAAHRHGVDPARLTRVAWCESRWNPNAVGPAVWNPYRRRYDRAQGLLQFMPDTWAAASYQVGMAGASPFDPEAAAEVGAYWFRRRPWEWVCK